MISGKRQRQRWGGLHHPFQPGDIAECRTDMYSTIRFGARRQVKSTHWTNNRPVLVFHDDRWGDSSYYASNFINVSGQLYLVPPPTPKEQRMANNKPCFAVRVEEGFDYRNLVNQLTGHGDRAQSYMQFITADTLPLLHEAIRTKIAEFPNTRWLTFVPDQIAELERPVPPVAFRRV